MIHKVCQLLAAGRCFFLGTPVSSNYETDLWDQAEIVLKVALKTIALSLPEHISSQIILVGFVLFNL